MKRKIAVLLLAVLCFSAVCCLFFWRQAQEERGKWQQLCQISAAQSAEHFREYQNRGAEELYWYGMAEFRVFMTAYHYGQGNVPDETYHYNLCSTVYGQMALHPEKVRANLPQLIEALELLAENHQSVNAFLKLQELKNQLLHG